MCKVIEIEAFVNKLILVQGYFPFLWYKFRKDPPVFAKDVSNVPHIIGGFAVQAVVVIVTAHIRTKFLIHPSGDGFTTIEAIFFHFSGFERFYKIWFPISKIRNFSA